MTTLREHLDTVKRELEANKDKFKLLNRTVDNWNKNKETSKTRKKLFDILDYI